VVGVVRNLRVNAVRMAAAVCTADVKGVGAALGAYWAQKKSLATGAEPQEVCMCMRNFFNCILGRGGGWGGVGGAPVFPFPPSYPRPLSSP
jgi:hypothetical protein